jgi:tetratricopeptide (TPR) repeat protein
VVRDVGPHGGGGPGGGVLPGAVADEEAPIVHQRVDLAPASGSFEEAERLAHRLGGLPLALHLAGAALAEVTAMPSILVGDVGSPCTFAQYGHALDEQFTSLFPPTSEEVAADPHQARQLVGQTWQLSLTQLSSSGFPDARPLLRLLACFGDAPIPYGLLLNPGILAGSPLFPGITGRRLWDVLQALDGLNLITLGGGQTTDPTSFTASLHPLVRETNAVHADGGDPSEYPTLAARLIAASAETPISESDDSPEAWPRWLALAPHVFHVLQRLEAAGGCDAEVAPGVLRAATLAARCHFGTGLYRQAESELRSVLNVAGLLLGEQHPEVLATRHQLARVLHNRGHPAQAAAELQIVLEARRKTFGEDHPGTLATRNQLAWTLRAQGLRDDAERELEAIIEAKTRVLGGEHPDTLVARMDLAQVRHEQGHHERAAAEYADVLAARRRILGNDHTKTLATRHNLATTLDELGQRADAAAELREVLDRRRRVLGEDPPGHPRVRRVVETRPVLMRPAA